MTEPAPSSSNTTKSTHIRPKVRRPNNNRNNQSSNNKIAPVTKSIDDSIEETRQRMESWIGLGELSNENNIKKNPTKQNPQETTVVVIPSTPEITATTTTTGEPNVELETKPPTTNQPVAATTSILKRPKYTKPTESETSTAATNSEANNVDVSDSSKPTKKPPVVKGGIIERDPTALPPPLLQPRASSQSKYSHSAIEGYVPKSSKSAEEKRKKVSVAIPKQSPKNTNDQQESIHDNSDEPLILSSVADMFEATGQKLPENKIDENTRMVEANISFSCMTQEQYKETLSESQREEQRQREEQYEIFSGRDDVFGQEENVDNPSDDLNVGDDDDDGFFMDMLLEGNGEFSDDDDNGNNNNNQPAELRSFLKMWNVLSEWITPQAVEWLKQLSSTSESLTTFPDWTPQVDRSDVGASRCAGLMAMLKMNLPKSMEELQQPHDRRRIVEMRLGDFLRTFDYTMPTPKLDLPIWRAMTTVLLDIVVSDKQSGIITTLPKSVAAVQMTIDEYRYLTRSAIPSLGKTATDGN